MENRENQPVIFLPGALMPAAIQYEPLLHTLEGQPVQPFLKDLEVYKTDTPPSTYNLEDEIEGLRQFTDEAGLQTFHLVGYSAGGGISLAFVAQYPERVRSLALTEPNAIPARAWFEQEVESNRALDYIMTLSDEEQMTAFTQYYVRPDVPLPPKPQGPPPPWIANRPAGLREIWLSVNTYNMDLDRLRHFTHPVYIAIGDQSNPVEERKAGYLAQLFPDAQIEVYQGRHHFDPPQRAEPERYARALLELIQRAEQPTDSIKKDVTA